MRVVAYCRVSTESEEQYGSLKEQEKHFKDYCKREKYSLIKTYSDRGRSGKNVDREGFKEMLENAGLKVTKQDIGNTHNIELTDREPSFDYILVKDVSRFSRSVADGKLLVKQLREKNVHIIFENNNINTKTHLQGNDIVVDQMLNMLFAGAESESLMNSQRQKASYLSRAKRNEAVLRNLPYGYIKDANKQVIQHAKQAEVVRYVFKRILKVGIRTICAELNAKEIKSLKGKEWSFNRIRVMITNTLYYGTLTTHKYFKKQLTSVTEVEKDSDKWLLVSNAIDNPIVSYEEWKQANDALKGRKTDKGKGKRIPVEKDIFSGKLVCGYCGGHLTRNSTITTAGERYYSYVCTNRRERLGCKAKSINFPLLNDKLLKEFNINHFHQDIGLIDELIFEKVKEIKVGREQRIQALKDEVENLNKRIFKAQTFLLDAEDKATEDSWKERINIDSNMRDSVQRSIYSLESDTLDKLVKKTKDTKKAIELLATKVFDNEEKLEHLEHIKVYDDSVLFVMKMNSFKPIIDDLNTFLDEGNKLEYGYQENLGQLLMYRSKKHEEASINKLFLHDDIVKDLKQELEGQFV